MQKKIICYFETEAQCEAAVTALCSANIDADSIRILSESTMKTDGFKNNSVKPLTSSAPLALPNNYQNKDSTQSVNHAQAPIATLLIRGDLFTFDTEQSSTVGSYGVEVCGNADTLELAKDILLNLF